MTTKWPPKDPDELLDYSVDWGDDRLNGDTIASSLWLPPVGINVVSESFSDTIATIWLSGGTIGDSYDFVNRITTAGGRVMDKTVRLKIKER